MAAAYSGVVSDAFETPATFAVSLALALRSCT
jgi:hypothetical protein